MASLYRIIAVGRTCSVMTHIPVASLIRPISNHGFNLNQLNKVWHVWPGSIHGALVVKLVEAFHMSGFGMCGPIVANASKRATPPADISSPNKFFGQLGPPGSIQPRV
jgi:hypothetical protein